MPASHGEREQPRTLDASKTDSWVGERAAIPHLDAERATRRLRRGENDGGGKLEATRRAALHRLLVLLTALTMFIFALLGMELFGGAFTPETGYSLQPCSAGGVCDEPGLVEKPQMHFDYFGPVRRQVSIPAPLGYRH